MTKCVELIFSSFKTALYLTKKSFNACICSVIEHEIYASRMNVNKKWPLQLIGDLHSSYHILMPSLMHHEDRPLLLLGLAAFYWCWFKQRQGFGGEGRGVLLLLRLFFLLVEKNL